VSKPKKQTWQEFIEQQEEQRIQLINSGAFACKHPIPPREPEEKFSDLIRALDEVTCRERILKIITDVDQLIVETKQFVAEEPDKYAAKILLESIKRHRDEIMAQLDDDRCDE
jgi:hypothetical protein